MKIYCSCCDKVQPVRIDNCRDAKTNEPFQDIVCAECDLVIAAGTDIAQQQEPVAWRTKNATPPGGYVLFQQYPQAVAELGGEIQPLYTSPPIEATPLASQRSVKPWVGLTDEEVVDLKMLGRDLEFVSMKALRRFARDIEATLKEKNA